MCESRREPGAGREPREPSGGMATQKATSQLNLESGEVELPGDADFAAFVERAV